MQVTGDSGPARKLPRSHSLFDVADGQVRLYVRYSRIHSRRRAFFGLRAEDIRELEGRRSVVCFLWDGQQEPLMLPFCEYEEVFREAGAAPDGQYKVQVFLGEDGAELYIPRAGRFNAEQYFGYTRLEEAIAAGGQPAPPELSHSQVQTLLGSIGASKGYSVWIPANDRGRLDWSLTRKFPCQGSLPEAFLGILNVLSEVDVIWIPPGSSQLRALFEVEHSTPIYSGLLRLNDVHLAAPDLGSKLTVVANMERRSLFVRQLNRPTFRASGLNDSCSFLDYDDVYRWHVRTALSARGRLN